MRIFTKMKHALLVVAVLLCAETVWAQDPNLAEDYTLVKSASFGASGCTNVTKGNEALSIKAYETGNRVQQSLYPATAPEDIVGWVAFQAVQSTDAKGWWNRSGKSLYSYAASRAAAIYGEKLTLGSIVAITCNQTASNVITLTNGNGEPDGTFFYQLSENGRTYYCTITAEENAYVGFCGNNSVMGITNISIYQPNTPVVPATYQVKYQDADGNELKATTIEDGFSGFPVSITATHKSKILNGGICYIYDSDDAASQKIAADGSTVVTVTFREAETWSYTANAVDGDDNVLKVLGTGSNFEGETVKVPYNQYILKSGVLYEKGKGISYNNEFNWAFTLSADKQISNLTYNVSSLENVVYFSEAEDVDGMTDVTTGNANIRCSNSVGAYNASETPVELLTLTPGTYTITAQVWGNKNKVTVDDVITEVPVPLYVQCGNETLEVGTQGYLTSGSKEFTVTENTKVIIPKAGSSGSSPKCIDWILIQSSEANSLLVVEDGKNLDVEGSYGSVTYTRSIAAGAYGTICLPFAPDAASLEAYNFYELTASTVSGIAGEVTFTKVDAPEANKPYIYCLADKDATEAPAITGGATEVSTEAGATIISDWQMVGSFKADTVDCTDKAIYALNGTTQKLMKVTQSLYVPAYRAYIEGTSSQLDLQMLTVRISGPTGIEQISAADVEGLLPATIYDLMGRPVQNPQKGHLYIQGGKKIVY